MKATDFTDILSIKSVSENQLIINDRQLGLMVVEVKTEQTNSTASLKEYLSLP